MSLLTDDMPTAVCLIGDALMWNTEIFEDDADEVFDIAVSNRSILEIFKMQFGKALTDGEKQWCLLRMFYLDNVPDDHNAALELACEFMSCGKGTVDKGHNEPSYYSWTQDGDFIRAAINQSFSNILHHEPDLHWWEFVNCFLNINENCRINEIMCNRAAHRKNKATKEQREARRLYPEIYILKESEPQIAPESKSVFDRMTTMWK